MVRQCCRNTQDLENIYISSSCSCLPKPHNARQLSSIRKNRERHNHILFPLIEGSRSDEMFLNYNWCILFSQDWLPLGFKWDKINIFSNFLR